MVERWLRGCFAVVCCLGLASCSGAGEGESMPSMEPALSATELRAEMDAPVDLTNIASLKIGDRGEGVRQAYRFFLHYGYFENEILRQSRPEWSPVVDVVPHGIDTYGAELETVVRAYQARAGVAVSGAIDEATLDAMRSRTCAVPDSFDDDVLPKWDLLGNYLRNRVAHWPSVIYRVTSYPAGIPAAQVDAALESAMRTWGAAPTKFFDPLVPNNVTFRWATTLPWADTVQSSATITFDSGSQWAIGAAPGKGDIETIAVHEFGHMMGFAHTSIFDNPQPVMWPGIAANTTQRALRLDDGQALLASPYSSWYQWPGTSVSHFAINYDMMIWAINTTPDTFGSQLMRIAGSGWMVAPSGGGVKVALLDGVPGQPFVLTNSGFIYKRTGVTTSTPLGNSTEFLPGTATDIATCPAENTLFRLGTDPYNGDPSNHPAAWFEWSTNTWHTLPIGGVSIALDSECFVWVIKADKSIWRIESSGVAVKKVGAARAIGAGPIGRQVWVIGNGAIGNDFGIYVWNEQPAGTFGGPKPIARARWVQTSGAARGVTVSRVGPFVWTSTGALYQRERDF